MQQDQALVQEVLAAEQAWLEAHTALDVEAIDHLMHSDYTIIRPDGAVVGKEEALASYQDDARHWDYAQSDQLNVRLYDDTAVVIGRWRAKGVNKGEAFDYSARYTSVWVRHEGRWQMVADQSTPIR